MPRLPKDPSQAALAEAIRSYRNQGYSEAEATERAYGRDEDTPVEDAADDGDDRHFVIVTKDFSGLGWAKALHDEGEQVTLAVQNEEDEPELKKQFHHVAKGWIPVMDLDKARRTLRGSTTYWVFAENNYPEIADGLRKAGQKVWGTSALTEKLEHDRQYAVDVATKAGLRSPETHEFSSRQEGLAFLDAHPDTAYVFKPDDGKFNYMTFVPVREADADANRETHTYLSHMSKEPGTYILQERVSGVEFNVECWLEHGEPCFAFVTLESKRKNVGDLGEMAGCAGDVLWTVPVSAPIVKQTVGKLLDFYRDEDYTGFADVNVILTKQGPLFLEVCNRFGYNAHVSLFLGLATDTLGNILADLMDGEMDDPYGRFRSGAAASVTVFMDHPRDGLPVHIAESEWDHYYPFDGYMEEGQLLLTGYSDEIGVLASAGATPKAALESCLRKLDQEAVSVPDMYYRSDLADTGYPNAMLDRYQALKTKGLV